MPATFVLGAKSAMPGIDAHHGEADHDSHIVVHCLHSCGRGHMMRSCTQKKETSIIISTILTLPYPKAAHGTLVPACASLLPLIRMHSTLFSLINMQSTSFGLWLTTPQLNKSSTAAACQYADQMQTSCMRTSSNGTWLAATVYMYGRSKDHATKDCC